MHKTTRYSALAVVALALAGTTYATAQDKATKAKPPTTTGADATCPMDDAARSAMAVQLLHAVNQSEIEHAKLAMDRAQAPEVKQYAKHMVDEHTRADQKLTDTAKKKGISLTASAKPADPVHVALLNMDKQLMPVLKSKSGAAFDAVYIAPEVSEHMLVVGAIEELQRTTQDTQLKSLLEENHKMISSHRDMGLKIVEKMRITGQTPGIGGGPKSGMQK